MPKLSHFILLLATLLTGCAGVKTAVSDLMSPSTASPEMEAGLSVRQTDKGLALVLSEAILFETGQSQLRSGVQEVLDNVAKLIQDRTTKDISIEGHTDNRGEKAYNQRLSEKRAKAVFDALVKRGVPSERLRMVGYGMERPVASNETPEGQQKNRRVEIFFLGERQESLLGSYQPFSASTPTPVAETQPEKAVVETSKEAPKTVSKVTTPKGGWKGKNVKFVENYSYQRLSSNSLLNFLTRGGFTERFKLILTGRVVADLGEELEVNITHAENGGGWT
jgi:outer membrane protein OmpA-like peptidoglycan-associated protein